MKCRIETVGEIGIGIAYNDSVVGGYHSVLVCVDEVDGTLAAHLAVSERDAGFSGGNQPVGRHRIEEAHRLSNDKNIDVIMADGCLRE